MDHRASNRLVVLALLAAIIVGLLSVVPAGAQSGQQATVRPDVLNMRYGPGSQYAVIAELRRGTVIDLLARNGTWLYGRTPGGTEGWVATDYLDLAPGVNLDVLPFRDAPADLGTPMERPAAEQSSPVPAPAEQSAPVSFPEGTGIPGTAMGTVNLRSGPGSAYRVLTTVAVNTALLVKGRNDSMDWIFVSANGQDGWMFWEYVRLSSGAISSLPVTDVVVNQVTAASSAPAQPAPAAAGAIPAPVSGGAGLNGFGYGGHVDSFAYPDLMRAAGMTWAKRQIRFEPGAPGSVAAGAINQAHANGFKVLLGIVGYAEHLNNPGYFEDYARFVGEVAALGPDAIEVWNEMNIDREWPTGQIDPAMYTRLLAQSYNAIKSANPSVAVISGALAPTGAEGAFGRDRVMNDDGYLRGMAAAGAARYVDCIGAHYNEGIVSPDQTSGDPRGEYYSRYFWSMVNLYYGAFGGQRPICFTELGYVSPEGFGPLPDGFGWGADTSVAEQASWLARAIQLARSSGKVRLVIVWNVDFTQYEGDPMAGYAIVRPGGVCPACDALAAIR